MAEILDAPLAPRGNWLKNGNRPGDPSSAPRCRAHSKRTGNPCKGPAMKNGICRMHGGKSTGPRSKKGKARSRSASLKHGRYSAKSVAARKKAVATRKEVRFLIWQLRFYFQKPKRI